MDADVFVFLGRNSASKFTTVTPRRGRQGSDDEEVNGELFENHGCSEIEENCTMYGRDV